ncbi:MAG TPA: phosphatase PAP2 family protein [Polyangiaceae bacterium]
MSHAPPFTISRRGGGARKALLAFAVFVCVVGFLAKPAAAQTGAGTVRGAKAEVEVNDGHRLHWTYPKFRLWQLLASLAVSGTNLYLQYGIEGNFPSSGWNEGLLFDDASRDLLVADTLEGRNNAAEISDLLWHTTQYYPIIVDSLFVPLVTDKFNVEVALQMNAINWQVQGLAFFLVRLSHRTVGRGRPSLQECADDPTYDGACDPDSTGRTASFIGGHVAMAMSGAGLVCAHHQALPLYGGNIADGLVCGVALASALTTGALRVVADRHWMTDILVGAGIGGALGYGLPYFLHYRHGKLKPLFAEYLPENTVVYPLASSSDFGLGFAGMF